MISGKMFCDAVVSASKNLLFNEEKINFLNVFPVPDGDTGTNMSLSLKYAEKAVKKLGENVTVSEASKVVADALLMGARGNSGVILSLIFKGFSDSLKDLDYADSHDTAKAFRAASYTAYSAVIEPKEGTILTVMREAANKAFELFEEGAGAAEIWYGAYKACEAVLPYTRDMLPELSKAGVVDAGGQGLVLILQSMSNVFLKGKDKIFPITVEQKVEHIEQQKKENNFCTQVLLEKNHGTSLDELKKKIKNLGDSIVVADSKEIINIHIHTNNPGRVVEKLMKHGRIENVKIENMLFQQENLMKDQPIKEVGFVAVSDGKGFEELFLQMGADEVLYGGRTMNPSVDEIIQCINKINAKNIVVLPNNKNVILPSQQASKLSGKNVYVVPSKTVPEGIAALLNFDENISIERNIEEMNRQIKRVKTGLVVSADKDSVEEKIKIKKGDIVAIENGEIVDVENSAVQAAFKVAQRMIEKSNDSVVTVYYGKNADRERAEQVVSKVRSKCPSGTNVTAVMGGQEIYDFIISVE